MRSTAALIAAVLALGACAHKIRRGYYTPPTVNRKIEKKIAFVAPPDYPKTFELNGGKVAAGPAYLDAVQALLGALFASVERVPAAGPGQAADFVVRVGTDVFGGHSLIFEDARTGVPAGWFESSFARIEHPPTDEPNRYAATFFEQSSAATLDDIARRVATSEWVRLDKDEISKLDALQAKGHALAREGDHAGAFDNALAVFRAALPGSPRRHDAREDALRAAARLPPADPRHGRLPELEGGR